VIWSQCSIQTLREDKHPWLVRAGYKRGNEYLFLGQRTLDKIRAIGDLARVLDAAGVAYVPTSGAIAVESLSGDDVLVRGHLYAELLRRAVSVAQPPAAPEIAGDLSPEEFHTPGVKTIAQIAAFTCLPPTSQIKSVVMMANGAPVLVLLRGDHQLSEAKLAPIAGSPLRPATADELRTAFGADGGSLGPVRVSGVRILADEALRGRRNMIAGANRNDYHLRHVTPGEDFDAEFFDLRQAAEGDRSITDSGPLEFVPVHIVRDAETALAAIVEKNADADGLVLPLAVAPFTAIVTPVHPDRSDDARKIYEELLASGVDALLDDRDARPGVKFKDADLIGIPYRITVGKKFAEGFVEFVTRSPKTSIDMPAGEIRIP
jgi:prolyl-tRNA synthetase